MSANARHRALFAMLSGKYQSFIRRYLDDDMLFFMHIPKTAGTSFRYGAEEFFGISHIDYDYGADSPVTTERILQYFYKGVPDPWAYYASSMKHRTRMVSGHLTIDKFVTLVGIMKTITFIRDPIQRIASEFSHNVRHKKYEGSFRDFYTARYIQNKLTKHFNNVPLEAVGFIGLSEKYEKSLTAINDIYRLHIPFKEENCLRSAQTESHEVSKDEEEEIQRINSKDIELYDYCNTLLKIRLQMLSDGALYAHAKMMIVDNKTVSGWAWWSDGGREPVEVEVMLNGDVKDRVVASNLSENICYLQPPRRGYVGFRLPLKLREGDEVQCRIAQTDQLFPPSPQVITIS